MGQPVYFLRLLASEGEPVKGKFFCSGMWSRSQNGSHEKEGSNLGQGTDRVRTWTQEDPGKGLVKGMAQPKLAGRCRWGNATQRSSASPGPGPPGPHRYTCGFQPQRLDLSYSKMELSHLATDETHSTWGQSFVFTPINLVIMPQVLRMDPQNAFL